MKTNVIQNKPMSDLKRLSTTLNTFLPPQNHIPEDDKA